MELEKPQWNLALRLSKRALQIKIWDFMLLLLWPTLPRISGKKGANK